MTVFRLQSPKDGSLSDGKGWFKSAAYSSNAVNAIIDPDGGKGSDPTSIPSPFARIDLVRTAFNFVNRKGLKGDTSFHKIVSHTLDIGEIFFNYSNFGQKVSIAEWDKGQQLQSLLNNPSMEQKKYGQTLDMYLQQDAGNFHFHQMNKVYILKYNNIPIGGTSPVSLFFSTPNQLDFLNADPSIPDIAFPKGNQAFRDIKALYERDDKYIEFLFSLRAFYQDFSILFPEVDEYFRKNLDHLQHYNISFFNQLNNINTNNYNNYQNLGQGVFILDNLPLKTKVADTGPIQSDFTIVSDKYTGEYFPLVLKEGHPGVDENGTQLIYLNGPWNQQTYVPVEVPAQIEQRLLPGLGIKYPYLTIGDFLEPYIIQTIFPIDKKRFFDGNYNPINSDNEVSYLLPLKKMFFDFFDKEFLKNNVGGRKVFEIKELAGNAVRVSLRIPIKSGYIEYERTYRGGTNDYDNPAPDINNNIGAIVKKRFDLAIFPFFKFHKPELLPEYRIALIDGENTPMKINDRFSLSFFQMDGASLNEIQITHSRQRVEKIEKQQSGIKHFALRDNFDIIGVGVEGTGIKGILIPQFEVKSNGSDQFSFAVDLGTTYTHIEYSKNGSTPVPFSITKEDLQLVKLHDPDFANYNAVFPEVIEVFDNDFIPELIGSENEFYFPVRTSILELKSLQDGDVCFSMVERNIPFVYEKRTEKKHARIFSGLKWGLDSRTSNRIESFIATILLMIRNKVLLNNGNLKTTRIVWFYPLSMMAGRRFLLESKWNTLYKKYISESDENTPAPISESLAPFYYFRHSQGAIATDNPIVSIDIGGETSDIVFFVNNKPVLLTSFRFAADSVFRDAYRQNGAESNGFVQAFGKIVEEKFNRNQQKSLLGVYNQIKENHKVSDVIAFLFSLEKNKELKGKNIEINFNQWLAENEDFKIVFALFYVSVIYHIAKILKAKNLPLPRYITFSGTGSKMLNILSPKDSLLEDLTRLILEKVMEHKFQKTGINIIRDVDFPKEISCKGGLFVQNQPDFNLDDIKTILLGDSQYQIANGDFSYSKAREENFLKSVEKEVENFLNFFFELMSGGEFNFDQLLVQTQRSGEYKNVLFNDLYTFINEGLELKSKEYENTDQPVEETLFFYAIKGAIHNLVRHISSSVTE